MFRNLPQARSKAAPGRRIPMHVGTESEFDNTPRRTPSNAMVDSLKNITSCPILFKHNVACMLAYQRLALLAQEEAEDLYVVLNAWNEWAENMVIEPSARHGYRMLEAIRQAKEDVQSVSSVADWGVLSRNYVNEFANSNKLDRVQDLITIEPNDAYQTKPK